MSAGRGETRFGPRTPLPFALSAALLLALCLVLSSDPGPMPGDQAAADAAEAIRSPWLTERVERLTDFGSGFIVWPLVAIVAAGLAATRRWPEFAVLATAAAVMAVGVPALKEWVARPRPEDALFAVSSMSFPSGHAAHGAWYAFLALLAVHLSPQMKRPGILLAAATVFCILIGLSRVYLGVHYLSDVIGGWALALAAFTLWPVVARARGRLRHNLGDERLRARP